MNEIIKDLRDMSEKLVYLLEQERYEEAADVARYLKSTTKFLSAIEILDRVDAKLDETIARLNG